MCSASHLLSPRVSVGTERSKSDQSNHPPNPTHQVHQTIHHLLPACLLPVGPCCTGYTMTWNTTATFSSASPPYSTLTGLSLSDCAEACTSHPSCYAFNYVEAWASLGGVTSECRLRRCVMSSESMKRLPGRHVGVWPVPSDDDSSTSGYCSTTADSV